MAQEGQKPKTFACSGRNVGTMRRPWKRAGLIVAVLDVLIATRVPARAAADSFGGSRAGDQCEVAGVKLCWCPAGKFTMGSPPNEPERHTGEDQVEVTLTKGFWMGKFELTQGDWKHVIGACAWPRRRKGRNWKRLSGLQRKFRGSRGFCRKLTAPAHEASAMPRNWAFRLPTEAQWEYACRAGTTTATAFGDKLSSTQANFAGKPYNGASEGPSLDRATKVGCYPANAWGLHDMLGNEVEWCRDWYHAKLPGARSRLVRIQRNAESRRHLVASSPRECLGGRRLGLRPLSASDSSRNDAPATSAFVSWPFGHKHRGTWWPVTSQSRPAAAC